MEPVPRPPDAPTRSERRIGLFGGSFDPVHAGHLHAARLARDHFALDRVVFVPAFRSPFKAGREPAPGPDRLRMVELAIRDERAFEASDMELVRGGPSYTIDTVRALPRALGEREDVAIHLVLGSDNLESIGGWRAARELFERVDPIVIHREGEPDVLLDGIERDLGPEIAAKFARGYLRVPPFVASSTDVRAALEGHGESALVVPAPVLEWIRARGLYGTRA